MSLRIRVVCTTSVATVTPELLASAMAGRLPVLAARYAPTDEEDPRQVLVRLRIEREEGQGFGVWSIVWSADAQRRIRVDRWVGGTAGQERRDLHDVLVGREDEAAVRVREVLHRTQEVVCFELGLRDGSTMAWPVAMAAAAALALVGGGLIRADGEGWLEPKSKDVELVLPER